jgi:hypothetical protein
MRVKKSKKGDVYIGFKSAEGEPMHVSKHKSGALHIKTSDGKWQLNRPKNLAPLFDRDDILQTITSGKHIYGLVGNCPRKYDIVALDIAMHPTLLEGGLEDMCKRLHKFFEGGICPDDPGLLCMWAGFCKRKVNPEPYANAIRTGNMQNLPKWPKEVSVPSFINDFK